MIIFFLIIIIIYNIYIYLHISLINSLIILIIIIIIITKINSFAYVDFANIESAIKAMNSGKKPKLLGRVLRVEYAGEDATRRGYNIAHKKNKENHNKDNANDGKPAEPKPINIAKWDGELVTFKGQKTVFDDDDE